MLCKILLKRCQQTIVPINLDILVHMRYARRGGKFAGTFQ